MGRLRIRPLADEQGVSLVELVVVCALLGVVMAGLTTVFVGVTRSQTGLEQRFRAQQTARVALDALRTDAHAACAANVGSGGALLVLALVPSGGASQCGAVSTNPKISWCTVADTTGGWSLYRTTGTTACGATGALEAKDLTTATPFSSAATIPVEQRQTVSVTLPVRVPAATGAPYALAQGIALGNTVYERVGATTPCSTTDATVCLPAPCLYGSTCYPPVIQ